MQRKDDLFIFVVKKFIDLFLDVLHMVKWPKFFPRCQVVHGSEAEGRILLKEILWCMHETLYHNKDEEEGEGRRDKCTAKCLCLLNTHRSAF